MALLEFKSINYYLKPIVKNVDFQPAWRLP